VKGSPQYRVFPPPHALSAALGDFLRGVHGLDFEHLSSLFPVEWKVYVMGGLPRDLLLQQIRGMKIAPADLDVVIDGADSMDAVRARLGNCYISANDFGGAKCRVRPGGMVIDIWRIEDHVNMATAPLPHTIEQLLRRNLLDIDAILWDPRTDRIHDCGCRVAAEAGCFDVLGKEGIAPAFLAAQAAHILVVAHKTGLRVSERARAMVRAAWEEGLGPELLRIARRKTPYAGSALDDSLEDLIGGMVSLSI
jgi:hypothetical protein